MPTNISSLEIGDAFLIATPPNLEHLYIAIALLPNGKHLLVNLSTSISDRSCVLNPDPMIPFINRESYVAYRYAREYSVTEINELINMSICQIKPKFPDTVIMQIQQGGCRSTQLAKKYKQVLN